MDIKIILIITPHNLYSHARGGDFIYLKEYSYKILLVFLILVLVNSVGLAQDDFEELKIPTEVQDLINNFAKIEYDIITFNENGEKSVDSNMKYVYLG